MFEHIVVLAAALATSVSLQGCGGSSGGGGGGVPVTMIWQKHAGMRCNTTQDLKAAYPCGDEGIDTVDGCKAKCEALEKCEGISMTHVSGSKDKGQCELVRRIVTSICDQGTGTDTYVFTPRWQDVLLTNASKAWSLHAQDVVDKANKLYLKDDDGVLIHMIDEGLPWQANGTYGEHMSWCLINKATWSGMIKIYRDGLGTSILGTPTAREEMLECFFPCDGFSDARTMKGCGKQTAQSRMCDSDSHNEDWCKNDGNVTGSYYPNKYDPEGHNLGWPCAFQPSQLGLGLQRQTEYKNGAQGPLNWICTWQHPPAESHNEALINGFKWNAALPNNVWAFAITSACEASKPCVDGTLGSQQLFKRVYGKELPVVKVDLRNNDKPFSVYSATHHHESTIVS